MHLPFLSPLLHVVGKHIAACTVLGGRLIVTACSIVRHAACPDCGRCSRQRHGAYWRRRHNSGCESAATCSCASCDARVTEPQCRPRSSASMTGHWPADTATAPALCQAESFATELAQVHLPAGSNSCALHQAITALRRLDPMVFSRTVTHTGAAFGNDEALGPESGRRGRFGTALAASPDTSWEPGMEVSRLGRHRLDGTRLAGPQGAVGSSGVGVAALLTTPTLLSILPGDGGIRDGPDSWMKAFPPVRFC